MISAILCMFGLSAFAFMLFMLVIIGGSESHDVR
jgi:hypothetical protein